MIEKLAVWFRRLVCRFQGHSTVEYDVLDDGGYAQGYTIVCSYCGKTWEVRE